MKKFFALVLTLVLALSVCCSSAYAVEFLDSEEEEVTEVIEAEEAMFLLTKGGDIIGVLSTNESRTFTLAGIHGHLNTAKVFDGKVIRAKGWAKGAVLGEDNMLANGTKVKVIVTFTEAGEAYVGLTANELVDGTIVAKSESILAHRLIDTDRGVIIAQLKIEGTNKVINIWEADWDGDGDTELCLRAGWKSSKSNGSSETPSTPNGDREDVDHSDNSYSDDPWKNSSSSSSSTTTGGRGDVTGSNNGYSDSPW